MKSGPLLLFDSIGHVIIMSPFSRFMSASLWHNHQDKAISWGIMGDVKEIPAGFQYDTMLMYGDQGINQVSELYFISYFHYLFCIDNTIINKYSSKSLDILYTSQESQNILATSHGLRWQSNLL